MAPPPATPASTHKFLLSKRQPNQSQQHITPSQATGGARQFNATPRFSVSSTPRAASSQTGQFSTPAVLPPRGSRATQNVVDIESSPELSGDDSPSAQERHDVREGPDLITSFTSESPRKDPQGGRSPKRRRISISPVMESSPPHAAPSDILPASLDIDIDPSFQSSAQSEDFANYSEADSLAKSQDDHGPGSPSRPASPPRFLFQTEPQTLARTHQAFKPPPQFRQPAANAALQNQYPLPDAFSPQRRGAKYVNGGLAGELRDWLVDMKGNYEAPNPTTTAVATRTTDKGAAPAYDTLADQVVVEEFRLGSGFSLVYGDAGDAGPTRMVLAGDGRLTGLAERKNVVKKGCRVAFMPPMWDVTLDGQSWRVACDWYVIDGDGP